MGMTLAVPTVDDVAKVTACDQRVDTHRMRYTRAFEAERRCTYPVLDRLEQEFGYAVNRTRMEDAARVLACPVKRNPPNWQHGRVIYALLRRLASSYEGKMHVVDVGTAKGYSALVARWALDDAGKRDSVVASVDVIDPTARIYRNTIAEADGPLTLAETLTPWREDAARVWFCCARGADWLRHNWDAARLPFAFVDGKHTYDAVREESEVVSTRQKSGDVMLFDDAHIPQIERAIEALRGYRKTRIDVLPHRAYVIAVRN